jgi:hypothetical protein
MVLPMGQNTAPNFQGYYPNQAPPGQWRGVPQSPGPYGPQPAPLYYNQINQQLQASQNLMQNFMGQITSHLETQRQQFEERLDEVARHADEAAQSSFADSKRREQSLKAEMAEATQSRVAFSLGTASEGEMSPDSPINQGLSEKGPINQDTSARRRTLAGISDKNFEF